MPLQLEEPAYSYDYFSEGASRPPPFKIPQCDLCAERRIVFVFEFKQICGDAPFNIQQIVGRGQNRRAGEGGRERERETWTHTKRQPKIGMLK